MPPVTVHIQDAVVQRLQAFDELLKGSLHNKTSRFELQHEPGVLSVNNLRWYEVVPNANQLWLPLVSTDALICIQPMGTS